MSDLLTRLLAAGSEGADLSPGDPLCLEAYTRIVVLQMALEELMLLINDLKS